MEKTIDSSIQDEIKLGNILLKNGTITNVQLREALVKQESADKSTNPTLGEILLNLNYITPDDLQRALRVQRANLKNDELRREEKRSRLLGKEAVEMGLLTYEQLEECIAVQSDYWEQGARKKIGEILVDKGFATEEQILELIEFQNGVPSSKISTMINGSDYSINLNLEKNHYTSLDEIIKHEINGEKHLSLSEIGHGGNGKVNLCIDSEIRRYVAMKVMLDSHKPSKVQQARFIEEAQITGQLEHPNIVPIHEVGVDKSGSLFFTMKYVTGKNLEESINIYYQDDRPKNSRQKEVYFLNILLKICDAIKFAHFKGVIHRDIKPENIMIGSFGEVMVMDWGSAKVKGTQDRQAEKIVTIRKDTNVLNTVDGTMIGTPLYMSPEQARGAINEYDIRTDIYGIGAVLFKMLTNQPPAEGDEEEDVLRDVVYGKPRSPRDTMEGKYTSKEVEYIVMKAIAKNKEDRYLNIEELQKDITDFIQDGIIKSWRYSPIDRLISYFKYNKKHAWSITAMTIITSISLYCWINNIPIF